MHPPAEPLRLPFLPPLDGDALLAYFAARATPGTEVVSLDERRYARSVSVEGHAGVLALGVDGTSVIATLSASLHPVRTPLEARLRRLLDLDADPAPIVAHLGADPVLAPIVARRPGLRVPGCLDGFELALRTVLGQQVSVRGATTLAGRLVRLLGEPLRIPHGTITHLPVTAARLADATVEQVARIGLPRARAAALVSLARAVAEGALPELEHDATAHDVDASVRRLRALPGIGAWTASYVAMRAMRWADAFPETDLVLRRAMGGITARALRAHAERWRPWRAYAAQHLWSSGVAT